MEGIGSFDQFKVGNLQTLMYVPDFITETEETHLLNNIYGGPVSKWKSLKNRRLQNWGGVVHEKGLLPQDLPPWLTKITQRIYEKSGLFPSEINHVLINEYLPNQGIMIYGGPVSKWKSLKNRRLQNWGGVVHEKGLLPQDLPPWLTKIPQRIYEKSGLFPSTINHVLINEYLPNQGIMPHQDGPAYFPVVAILSLGSPVVMDFTPHSKLRTSTDTSKNNVDGTSSGGEAFVTETEEWIDNHHPFSVLLMLLIFKDDAYADYLHGIKDSEVQQYDGVVNEIEALMNHKLGSSLSSSEKAIEVTRSNDPKIIHRTSTRVSLTCRLVLKVHKNLFKFK